MIDYNVYVNTIERTVYMFVEVFDYIYID
jgi:hypothetical protein